MIAPGFDTATSTSNLLRDRVRTLSRHLPKAVGGDPESIHQMRVAGRRLRVALRMLAVKPEGSRVRRCLRGLRGVVGGGGGSRDLDVGLSLLEQRFLETGAPDQALRQVRGRLRAARTRGRVRMANDLLDQDLARLRRDLRAIVDRGGESLFVVLARMREERDAVAAETTTLLESAAEGFRPEALHRLRTRARRLRYVAELSDALREQRSEAPAIFRELQERLGHVHDSHVLSLWMAHQAELAGERGAGKLLAATRGLERHFLTTSHRLYRALMAENPTAMVQRGLQVMGARSAA